MRSTLLLLIAAMPLAAQSPDQCDERYWSHADERFCEVREYTLTDVSAISVRAGHHHGGIRIQAWDRPDILVQARVVARARSLSVAREIAGEVEVSANSSNLGASGPSTGRNESWEVSWWIYAPPGTDLDLQTLNGGIRVSGMNGRTRFDATNGGVTLVDMAGDVSGSTVNGGLSIMLDGRTWVGTGMDVAATNGGVELTIPDDYSAEFETGTVNGRLDLGFPITVQGRFGGRSLRFTLGDGGALIRARTTNGGVRITRG